jgi:hypothetical protein
MAWSATAIVASIVAATRISTSRLRRPVMDITP